MQQARHVLPRQLAHATVTGRIVTQIHIVLPDVLVEMHARACLTIQGLGHEGRSHAGVESRHAGDVFDEQTGIGGFEQGQHGGFNLALPGSPNLMVVVFDGNAHRFQVHADAGAQVVQAIQRRDSVIAAVQRDAITAAQLVALPIRLSRFHAVRSRIHRVLIGNPIEDIEFKLGSPNAAIGNAGLFEEFLSPNRNIARIVGENLPRVRLERDADETQGWDFPERIEKTRRQVRHHHHIAGTHTLESHTRAIETYTILHELRIKTAHRHGDMMPASPQVRELQVHLHDGPFLYKCRSLFKRLEHQLTPFDYAKMRTTIPEWRYPPVISVDFRHST
ncbi:MAG: hypothetical protein BWY63_02534 [Chloroflexi bacterium ADurb.Bin360]|nr:MAG: hypothetical protein BWY63_02534 [Chloroflexi bacterium ADurb.Bin360]